MIDREQKILARILLALIMVGIISEIVVVHGIKGMAILIGAAITGFALVWLVAKAF